MMKAKHGQRKQAWRDFPVEKNIASRVSDRTGEEEKHSSVENRVDLADEEVSGFYFMHSILYLLMFCM